MGEPYHAAIRGSGGGSHTGKLGCVDRLGNMVNPSSRGFGLHARVEASFHRQAVTIPTTRGGWRQLLFLGGRLVWSRTISGHTSALALDPGATVWTVWDAGWFPSLPSTLSDQRYADLLALHTAIVPLQLSERAPNIWVWCGGRFSICAIYRHIQDLESTSDSTMLLK